MGKFYTHLDESFDDFLSQIKQKELKKELKEELIKHVLKLKSSLIIAYNSDNNDINDYFKVAFAEIDFKI